MDDAVLVCRMDRVGQRGDQRGRRARRLRDALQLLRQTAAVHELHREVGPPVHVTNFVDLDDARVRQSGSHLGLALEALALLR